MGGNSNFGGFLGVGSEWGGFEKYVLSKKLSQIYYNIVWESQVYHSTNKKKVSKVGESPEYKKKLLIRFEAENLDVCY